MVEAYGKLGDAGEIKMDEIAKIKARRSYKDFSEWLEFLNTNPSKKALLEKFHTIKDNCSGYGSQRNSDAALESLQFVLKEKGVA
jgi:hypothetical protein